MKKKCHSLHNLTRQTIMNLWLSTYISEEKVLKKGAAVVIMSSVFEHKESIETDKCVRFTRAPVAAFCLKLTTMRPNNFWSIIWICLFAWLTVQADNFTVLNLWRLLFLERTLWDSWKLTPVINVYIDGTTACFQSFQR